MHVVKLILKATLAIVGVLAVGAIMLAVVFGWSSSNAEQANAECSMLIIEKKIEPIAQATAYRRACMASKNYGMQSFCYFENYDTASCFIPRWMFWVNTI